LPPALAPPFYCPPLLPAAGLAPVPAPDVPEVPASVLRPPVAFP